MSERKKKTRINPAFNRQNLSRTIPSDVKLEVRRRCGFGCVICGLGIYEYEHFSPEFKHATAHEASGITLLCPNHHEKKTKGLLAKETVVRRNANPEALKRGFVNEELDLSSDNLTIVMGTVSFTRTSIALQIGDEPILSIAPSGNEDEPYHLSATLRDSSGNIILEIDKNEWKTTTSHWDCKTIGNRIQIRSEARNIELIIRHTPPNELHVERLRMTHRGCVIEAHESNFTRFTTSTGFVIEFKNYRIDNWKNGIILHTDGSFTIGSEAGEGGGTLGYGILRSYHVSNIPANW